VPTICSIYEVHAARKKVLVESKKESAFQQAEVLREIGVAGCLACRSATCKWHSAVDEVLDMSVRTVQRLKMHAQTAILQRRATISDEIERVRRDPEAKSFESCVPLSAQSGGRTKFYRNDLLAELVREDRALADHVRLNRYDRT
jgi:type II secretory ATPase GspE/PulE/Tfp pilus assembly ATPase PilB-like protein